MNIAFETPSEEIHIATLNAIASLHDEVSVSPTEASLFLRRSERTLARLRNEGKGPRYQQPLGRDDVKARNQSITYTMGDLRKWRTDNTIQSSMEAAVKRGLTFQSLADLQRVEPFWLSSADGRRGIVGHAMTISPQRYQRLLNDSESELEWMSLDEALQQRWLEIEQRENFDNVYADVVNTLVARNLKRSREDSFLAIAIEEAGKAKKRI